MPKLVFHNSDKTHTYLCVSSLTIFVMENVVLVKVKYRIGYLFNIVLKQLKVEYRPGKSSWGHDKERNSLLKGQCRNVNWFSWSLGKEIPS